MSGKAVVIPLTKGRFATVDAADLHLVSIRKWHTQSRGYAAARINNKIVMMHNVIYGEVPDGCCLDHANGNKTDNRRENLRVVTNQQNSFNTKSHSDSSSRFKGVFWSTSIKRWRAVITVGGKRKHLGTFKDEVKAAKAYDEAASVLQGIYAKLNFAA